MSTKHELQTNELATWLTEKGTAVQPYLKTIIGLAIVALVGMLAFSVMRGQSEGRSEVAWTSFFQAQSMGDADSAREVAKRFPKTKAAAWAWQWAGDFELTQASSDAFVDRADSREGLMLAKEAYEAALKSNPPSLIQRRSKFGLAQVHEALNELEVAEEYYEEIANRWPDSHVAKIAEDRIAFLQLPETRSFSDWFAKQKPRERVSQNPSSPSGISMPSASDDLPSDSELMLPDASAIDSARANTEFDSMLPPDAQPVDSPDEATPPTDTAGDNEPKAEVTSDADMEADDVPDESIEPDASGETTDAPAENETADEDAG